MKNLQINLVGDVIDREETKEQLELPTIGEHLNRNFTQEIELEGRQPERISILSNEMFGVCDVILDWDTESKSLVGNPADCAP